MQREGWTKTALDKMERVDSFLRESQRLYPIGLSTSFYLLCIQIAFQFCLLAATSTRKALEDFTFSDGTRVPAGTSVSASTTPTHYDGAYYEHPEVFNPWRFSDPKSADNGRKKYGIVDISAGHLPFGFGRHAW